jgi:DNA-binding response OmpR family regulator
MPASSERPLRVLMIDDNPDHRELYALYLTTRGVEVHHASDGHTGLSEASRVRPDVVVLDLSMPGLDGVATCRLLRREPLTAKVRVIALTAHSGVEFLAQASEVGFDLYLTKPCGPEVLFEEVRRLAGET